MIEAIDCDWLPTLVQREILIRADLLERLKQPDLVGHMVNHDMIPLERVFLICIYNNIPRTLAYILSKYDVSLFYPGDAKFIRILATLIMKNDTYLLMILLWNCRAYVFDLQQDILTMCAELYNHTYKFKLHKFKTKTRRTKLGWYILNFYDLFIRLCSSCNNEPLWDMLTIKVFLQTHYKYPFFRLLKDKLIDPLVIKMYDRISQLFFISHELLVTLYRLQLPITWEMVKYNKYQFVKARDAFVELADTVIQTDNYLSECMAQECFNEAIRNDDFEYFTCLLRHSKITVYHCMLQSLFIKPSIKMIEHMHNKTRNQIYYNTHEYHIDMFYRFQHGVVNPNAKLFQEFFMEHTHIKGEVHKFFCLAIDSGEDAVFNALLKLPMSKQDAIIPYNHALSIHKYGFAQAIKRTYL